MAKNAATKTTPAKDDPKVQASVPAVKKAAQVAVAEGFEGIDTGFEGVKADEYVIPFYTILQGLSPQMETVEGARLGHIINTTTNELKGTAINFVVVRRDHKFVEWLPNRGGFVASHDPESELVKKCQAEVGNDPFSKLTSDEGNDVLDTYYLFGVLCDENFNPTGLGVIGFTSTKIKKYKAWLSYASERLSTQGLPMPALVYKFSTFKDKNKKGEFYNWAFSLAKEDVEASRVRPGTQLYDMVMSVSKAKADLKADVAGERKADGDTDAM
jgi:hypothetical protein